MVLALALAGGAHAADLELETEAKSLTCGEFSAGLEQVGPQEMRERVLSELIPALDGFPFEVAQLAYERAKASGVVNANMVSLWAFRQNYDISTDAVVHTYESVEANGIEAFMSSFCLRPEIELAQIREVILLTFLSLEDPEWSDPG